MTESSEMSPSKPRAGRSVMLSDTVQIAQLLTLVAGLIIMSMNMGAKGEQLANHAKSLESLEKIVTDLTKSQIGTAKDVENNRNDILKLEALDARVRALETDNASRKR